VLVERFFMSVRCHVCVSGKVFARFFFDWILKLFRWCCINLTKEFLSSEVSSFLGVNWTFLTEDEMLEKKVSVLQACQI
jgi:hypothetical protein